MSGRTEKPTVEGAARAHTNLTMFHAIIILAEGGSFYGPHDELKQIVALAQRGAQRQLRLYDKARAALKSTTLEGKG